jgi:Tol biopolymer transport system component
VSGQEDVVQRLQLPTATRRLPGSAFGALWLLLAAAAPASAQPAISAVVPPSGPLGGGTVVTISGTLIGTATKVEIGGTVAAIDPGQTTPTSVVVTTPPAGAPGAGARDVVVTTPSGAVTRAGGFTYTFVSNLKEQNRTTTGALAVGGTYDPSFSADGRYLAFRTDWDKDTGALLQDPVTFNNWSDVLVRDRATNALVRVNVTVDGQPPSGASGRPRLSADGRYVAFWSAAENLVAGDTNQRRDIFVRDRDADGNGTFDEACATCTSTRRVSVSSAGAQANGHSGGDFGTGELDLSPDGRWVVFSSDATNLVSGDTAGHRDVFLHSLDGGQTTRISVGPGGIQANGPSRAPGVSAAGARIVFASTATNLVAGDTNAVSDVFLFERSTSTLIRLSEPAAGQNANGPSDIPSIDDAGLAIAYQTKATNLLPELASSAKWQVVVASARLNPAANSVASPAVPGQPGRVQDAVVNVVDFLKRLASGNLDGIPLAQPGNGDSQNAEICGSGECVGYATDADNLNPQLDPDTNNESDTVLQRVVAQPARAERISKDSNGNQVDTDFDGGSQRVAMDESGAVAAIQSAGQLVTDVPASGANNVFVSGVSVLISTVVPAYAFSTVTSEVTVRGGGFRAGVSVRLGSIQVPTTLDATSALRFQCPAGVVPPGVYDITVSNSDGESRRLAASFTVYGVPTVTGVTPTSGPAAGGTAISVTGTQFVAGVTSVAVGGVDAADVVVTSPTSLTAVTRAGSGGLKPVAVTTPAGTGVRASAFTYVVPAFTLTVSGAGAGSGVVASQPGLTPAIACTSAAGVTSGTCGVSYPQGTLVTLTASAPAGSRFTGWAGDCTGAGTCQVTINAARQVTATFLPEAVPTFTLRVAAAGAGSGLVTSQAGLAPAIRCASAAGTTSGACEATHASGTLVTLSASASVGSTFAGWTGACTGTGACQVTLNAAVLATATFDATPTAGPITRYLAEGATSDFFVTRVGLANVSVTDTASVQLKFQRSDGVEVSVAESIPPRQTRKVTANSVAGLEAAEFATLVESSVPLAIHRSMWWDKARGYGSHVEAAVEAPALTWYLAEGSTNAGFQLFYLIQNPNSAPAAVEVRFLRPAGDPLVRQFTINAASRFNIWVNTIPELAGTDVSAVITSSNAVPIIVERAMYLDTQGLFFGAGHESAGVTQPATSWFLAEGATGPYFDLFVLLANPGLAPANVRATYLRPDGSTVQKTYTLGPQSRFTVWVDYEDALLADTAVSTAIVADVPILVERAMWWPGGFGSWHEAHNSYGAIAPGTLWGLGEGTLNGPPANGQTYVLVANPSSLTARVAVSVLFDDGSPEVTKEFRIVPTSRFNIDVRAEFPEAVGKSFGVAVESLTRQGNDCTSSGAGSGSTFDCAPVPIVVEQAIYSDAAGASWAAGTNALATRFR